MHKIARLLAALVTTLSALSFLSPVSVQAAQDAAVVNQAIEDWLHRQTQGLPGEVSYEIGSLAAVATLHACGAFDISRPRGARPWGRTNILVTCLDDPGWRIYVSVLVRVKREYLVSARPISRGGVINAADLTTQYGDLSSLPPSTLTDAAQAIGKRAVVAISAGRPLRADLLRAPPVVLRGQTVKVISQGPGFVVSNEGRALADAAAGAVVKVKLGNGQIISGLARDGGRVEVGN